MTTISQFKVLITRPAKQQDELTRTLHSLGARSLSRPMISIDAIEAADQIEVIKAKVQSLDNYRYLIFVSSNAATIGSHWIDQYWPQFPIGVDLIALGPATALVLNQLLSCKVIQPTTGITSEDVLKLPQLESLNGEKIAIFRGSGGRELLAQTLKDRGATVDYIEVYSRSNTRYDSDQLCNDLISEQVNVISANSVETLKSLIENLGSRYGEFIHVPVLVPSARVAAEAEAMGFSTAVDCAGADTKAIIAALSRLADINI